MINGMKKLLAVALFSVSAVSSASVITFTVPDTTKEITFDSFVANSSGDVEIKQYHTGDFIEVGMTSVGGFKLGADDILGTGLKQDYVLSFDMILEGESFVDNNTDTLWIDFNTDSVATMNYQTLTGAVLGPKEAVADLQLLSGGCFIQLAGIFAGQGKCGLEFDFDVVAGGLFESVEWGFDLIEDQNATVFFDMDVSNLLYGAVNAEYQEISVTHEGSGTIYVSEPTSLAILGLGLLGLAGVRRRA